MCCDGGNRPGGNDLDGGRRRQSGGRTKRRGRRRLDAAFRLARLSHVRRDAATLRGYRPVFWVLPHVQQRTGLSDGRTNHADFPGGHVADCQVILVINGSRI